MKTKYFFILIFLKLINVPFLFSTKDFHATIHYSFNQQDSNSPDSKITFAKNKEHEFGLKGNISNNKHPNVSNNTKSDPNNKKNDSTKKIIFYEPDGKNLWDTEQKLRAKGVADVDLNMIETILFGKGFNEEEVNDLLQTLIKKKTSYYIFGKYIWEDSEAKRAQHKKQEETNKNQKEINTANSQPRQHPHLIASNLGLGVIEKLSSNTFDLESTDRLNRRIAAAKQTIKSNRACFDYSNQIKKYSFSDEFADVFNYRYGTALDKQLHEELCETREMALNLNSRYPDDIHAQIITPAVCYFTAQAKVESDAGKAFNLSDFCSDIVRVFKKGINIINQVQDFLDPCSSKIEEDVYAGVKTFLSPQHWQEMATGAFQIALICCQEVAQEDAFDDAGFRAMLSKDGDSFLKIAEEHCLYKQNQIDAFNSMIKEHREKIAKMSWEQIGRSFVRYGTTFILDALALNALGGFAKGASQAVVKQVSNVIKSGTAATERYAVEVAGFGKLMIEEGPEPVQKALDIISKNSSLIEKEGSITNAVRKVVQSNAANETGKAFEEFLVKKLGGKGSFTYLDREFDGAFGNVWYEAKSGKYWEMLLKNPKLLDKFQSDMGRGLSYALQNGATYELHSKVPVPQHIKDWLTKKGIKVVEWL